MLSWKRENPISRSSQSFLNACSKASLTKHLPARLSYYNLAGMKRRLFRVSILFILILLGLTGYIKGCDSCVLPKQKPISYPSENNSDSIVTVAAGQHYEQGELHEIIFGEQYRELWALPIEMPVFNITKINGGMKILHKGGSMQTLNLRLEDKEGKEYVLRTVDKDNANALPSALRNKVLNFIIRDQTSALNPYSALIIAPLAEAAGIFHTNPKLYYIPSDPNFGQYQQEFERRVVMLEEQPDESWIESDLFGKPVDIISTGSMLENKFTRQDILLDQQEYARARIFDLWINDWDRHADQWRWAEFKDDGITVYKPIPRDRDIAFFKFNSGILPKLVTLFNPKFQSFNYGYGNVEGLVKNAKAIDNLILNRLSKKDFINIAKELEQKLTDSVIIEAISHWPEEVIKKSGVETLSKLKTRRENLVKAAEEYYTIVFEEVVITGTDKEETFIIERLNDNETSVKVLDEDDKIIFQQTYLRSVTEEITLYGLKGDDSFLLTGNASKGLLVKIYGGEGKDKLRDHSFVKGYKNKTKVYDTERGNDFEFGPETEDLTTSDPRILYFDRTGER